MIHVTIQHISNYKTVWIIYQSIQPDLSVVLSTSMHILKNVPFKKVFGFEFLKDNLSTNKLSTILQQFHKIRVYCEFISY